MNPTFKIIKEQLLSNNWGKLRSVTFQRQGLDGELIKSTQEFYDVGNGAAVLLYNKAHGTVVLNHQFRLVTTYNGNPSGMLTEVCAGKVEHGLSPEATILKEIQEETGYRVGEVTPVMQLYMSPGSFTELLHFYVAEYDPLDRPFKGGGNKDEGEEMEVQEVPFTQALEMVHTGEIKDAKTVILLQYAKLNSLL